ncbi:NAD(P)-binding Rossmann-fold superfamily protein [Hibiscus syriacus]|uniref:NAD(P)-binding Rossmann-fold superfamily protein n=1 Tax=Hibiscus syriacus TaxID=106335 RepID=A0A6A3CFY3_HIBSY|nr:NAD(P)-binding Rossmann-fold superfamily protein [Hibiscus syriacus]
MVLIEPHPTDEHQNQQEEEKETTKATSVSSLPSETTTGNPATAAASANATGGDAASDGFETASERDVSDSEEDDRARDQQKGPDSYQDALNDDELKEKALSQANDAKMEGNKLFRNGQYEEALLQYEIALQVTAEMPSASEIRSICHSNCAVCFMKLETIKECSKALELNPSYIKALVRRGEVHEKLERFEEAIADMKKILELDPANDQARRTIRRLEPLAAEKREKMKEEMIGKLKELGNSVLGRFGMSVDNFKAVKDPNTGSYSISFQR